MPSIEVPSITADVRRADGTSLEIPIGILTDEDTLASKGFAALDELTALYKSWIQVQGSRITSLAEDYRDIATRNLSEADEAWERMKNGIQYLRENPQARKAFVLMNQAISLQATRPRLMRRASYQNNGLRITGQYQPPLTAPFNSNFAWRPFQIGFLLATIQSVGEPSDPNRETVDLLWFPTGGGKTEAYLALIAFGAFLQRIRNSSATGVTALMRYSLRLLTAQQFLRAARLICAMEFLRRQHEELGSTPFQVGIWLGGETTPNTRKDAVEAYRNLSKKGGDQNPFLLDRCPWCGAQMGRVVEKGKTTQPVIGFVRSRDTVIPHCPDPLCPFHAELPVVTIDEDIYERRPTLVVATVDKFAMLAWKPEARALFGLKDDGSRAAPPPSLIIQDELHLMSGPLGSLVGLYETLISDLCKEPTKQGVVVPKIVCATATTRRYKEQIRRLYARPKARVFPPPGLDISDSFFSQHATLPNGQRAPGTLYVGVYAPALRSMQSLEVWTIAGLLEAANQLPEEQRDAWWTVLAFFNSLRELGTTISLLQSDIPDHLKAIGNRLGIRWSEIRRVSNILELTSRLRSGEISGAITSLETPYGVKGVVDVCLASNIIEVGVDIDRLSLMVVAGQPKTTSQYIQVTGRVGRRWTERPALVVTLYNASKPRDRSHYEHFRSYHQRLYSYVEPSSVTPFSTPALERGLHALMVGYVRQHGDKKVGRSPYPCPAQLLDQFFNTLKARVAVAQPEAIAQAQNVFQKRLEEWQRWQRTDWEPRDNASQPLLYTAGSYISAAQRQMAWPTLRSLRHVDAQCEAEITERFIYVSQGEDLDA
ncbi:MAG: hypothetical protein K6U87_03280 [Firmicutes bacterium]|nr:hypothetical protein [Bacillota bacterium]